MNLELQSEYIVQQRSAGTAAIDDGDPDLFVVQGAHGSGSASLQVVSCTAGTDAHYYSHYASSFHRAGFRTDTTGQLGIPHKQNFFRIVDNVKHICHYQTIQGEPLKGAADYTVQLYRGVSAANSRETATIHPLGPPRAFALQHMSHEQLCTCLQVWRVNGTHYYPPRDMSL